MFSISSSAHDLEKSIIALQNDTERAQLDQAPVSNEANFIDVLNTIVVPILRHLQGTPARAIVLDIVVSFCNFTVPTSLCTYQNRPFGPY